MKRIVTTLALSIVAGLSTLAAAQSIDAAAGSGSTDAVSTAALSDGEVRKVDKEAKKLTLRHGPIENLGMPGMTMVFQVQDSALLDQVKAGDKVKFAADKIGGAFTVTRMEAVN